MRFSKLKKIYLASPRGFCAGVERAVKIVDILLRKFGPPIYVRHQIVHNQSIISHFEKKGTIFIENLKEIPDNSKVVFSAHGCSQIIYQQAKKKKLKVYDATCPLVTKVHLEAKRYYQEGYFIFYIGHKNHPETEGVLGEIPDGHAALIQTIEETKKIQPPQKEKLIVLTQTTLSCDDTKNVIDLLRKRFPKLILPPAFDICFATQNRQNAVKALAKKTDLILVVGSKNSSNSNRLKEIAEKTGTAAYLIDGISEINVSWLEKVENLGITAGASTPDYVINQVIGYFANNKVRVEELITVKESVSFPLPQIL
ncbi:4-hydroxy-3-methylbut-2-enyl diphosphate reductase [bacterium]|nr:MAG: 4-hydroxy-3-methylbut-2-enyl diphosphate reductase [bacterium]